MPQVGALIALMAMPGTLTVFGVATNSFIFRALASVAMSALSSAMQKKPRAAGLKTSVTAAGGTNPASFIIGRYATGGAAVCPPMSHGKAGKTPNAYLTYVINLGDIPGQTLERLIVNDEYATIGTVPHPDYGLPVLGRFEGYAWVKYHDGSQTVADPMLLAKYSGYPERPWSADMVGTGLCYAILTMRYNRKIFSAFPRFRFEMMGIPLYDPRADSSVGGSGAQRWADPSTWTSSANVAVQVYNIKRGIALPDGSVWGGGVEADDLPLGNWFAAMNVCDQPVALTAGGTEPQYRAALEIMVDQEPADVIEELLRGCSGQVAEIGGVWKIRIGAPALPVYFFTDDDVNVSRPQDFDPFPGLDRTWNGIHASYPEPDSLWESRDAPPLYNAAYEVADQGRRLVANLPLPAVPYGNQVQRIMRAYIESERRFRRHILTLPPSAAILEPFDVGAWTSARNGYVGKLFEVAEDVDDLMSVAQRVSLREVDPADYDWTPAFEQPWDVPSGAAVAPVAQTVSSWAVTAAVMSDASGSGRRPAIQMIWDGAEQDDVRGLEWELRLTGGAIVLRGSTHQVAAGVLVVADGILPATGYEARGRFVVDRPTEWSAWAAVTSTDLRLAAADFSPAVNEQLTGVLDIARFAQTIRPVEIVAALPGAGAGNFVGRIALLTTNGKVYRNVTGSDDVAGWTAAVDGADILANSIIAGRIAAGAVGAAEIAAGAITTTRLAAGVVTAEKLAAGSVSTLALAAGAVRATNMIIDENLSIGAADAGFQMGKLSATDLENNGIYLGRTLEPGGGTGFGFMVGGTWGGVRRYLQGTTASGLLFVNARHRVDASVPQAVVYYTTSQTIILAAGTTSVTLGLMGGGGGGSSGEDDNRSGGGVPGATGGTTTVTLFDGAVSTGQSWTATGAVGGTGTYAVGASEPGVVSIWGANFGTGGNGGAFGSYWGGGGGGGEELKYASGGRGGKAAVLQTIADIDVSGLASPRLVVTIGAGGAGGVGGNNGLPGKPGRISVQRSVGSLIPAAPIPQVATYTGQFTKAANATGNTLFPDFGPGLWVIWEVSGGTLGLGHVQVDTAGTMMRLGNPRSVSFVSDFRPDIITGHASATTIQFMFYGIE